jgi:hypothetical protein
MYNLRVGFLVRSLSIALVLGAVGAVLSELRQEIEDWTAYCSCTSSR